jgi:hypothetical protein
MDRLSKLTIPLMAAATTIAVLLLSASPASALWEATGTQAKGQVKFAGGAYLDIDGHVECLGSSMRGTWTLQAAGQIKGKQAQVKKGPDLFIQIKQWSDPLGVCIEPMGLAKFTVNVTGCELRLTQPEGSLTATAGFAKTCVLETLDCTTQAPAGMETSPESNAGINVGLKEVSLENKESAGRKQQVDKAKITGIYSQSSCDGLNETGELILPEFELENLEAI